jgi:hypothetical protein
MGFTSWLKQKIEGDPVERKFRKEAKAEAKAIETQAFHDAYKEELLIAAAERGREKAKRIAQKKGSGSGLLNTLGNLGENMNRASKGLVAGIEINPDGAGTNNPFNVSDPLGMPSNDEPRRHKRKGNSLDIVDPFDTSDFQ